MPDQSVSQRIAAYARRFSLDDVPIPVREHAKLMLLDAFGVALASSRQPHAQSIETAIGELSGGGSYSLWGRGRKVGLADAVLYNASRIHSLDYDDTHVESVVHPSAAVAATAFAVGEGTGASGRDILEAVILGYEIIIRLGLAAAGGFHDRGFHCTGLAAPFAAACVAARLQGLPEAVLVNALGICGSQAAALQEFLHDGSWVKKIHPGWGAHAAVYALAMARHGLTGPREVFEGSYGLFAAHLGTADGVRPVFEDLGRRWVTGEIAVKRYPVCHMAHSFIDCALTLKRAHGFAAEEVAAVECRIEPRCHKIICQPEAAKKRPATDYGMRFSLPFVVAMALVNGRVGPAEIDAAHLLHPTVLAIMDGAVCIEDPSKRNPGHFPGWVKIRLRNGLELEKAQPFERGAAENPVEPADIIEKFRANAAIALAPDKAALLSDQLLGLERLKDQRGILATMA
jgi:2-methylcitrate dehydratase PrpD